MTLVRRMLGAAMLLALAAGCAPAPTVNAPAPAIPPLAPMPQSDCGDLRFEQAGRMLRSSGTSVTLDRMPFVVHYTGPARDQVWLHAMAGGSLLAGVDRAREPQLWLVDGLGIANDRQDGLWLAGEAQLASTAGGQRDMAQRMGSSAFEVFRDASARHPQARALAALPFNLVRTHDAATQRLALRVNAIQGRPVAQTRYGQLDFVAMTVLDRLPVPPTQRLSLYRVGWSTCRAVFRGG